MSKNQLATLRYEQRRYADALRVYFEVLSTFHGLGEPGGVAAVWHQIGMVHQVAGQPDAAEHAYQESLKLEVQRGDALGEARTLIQLGILYSGLGRREDAVRCYRQSAEVRVRLRDLRGEGLVRNNLAGQLVELKRYDEARVELERAMSVKPFGHVALPWTTFEILSDLERAVGDEAAAQKAHTQAVQAYLAYRRDGGAPQNRRGELIASDPAGVLATLQQEPDLPPQLRALIPPLQAILSGSRDTTLADDPDLYFDAAAELLLLIERLQTADGA